MRIMGFDLATKSGYSLIDNGKLITYGIFLLSKDAEHRIRFREFKAGVNSLLKEHKPDMVVIEETYVGSNVKVTAYLNQLRGIFISCVPLRIKLKSGVVSNIRKEVLGVGKKHTKEDVFNLMVNKYAVKNLNIKKDLDITDSMLLAEWGRLTS